MTGSGDKINANEKGLKELLRDGSISRPETAAVWYQSQDIARRLNKRISNVPI